MEWLYLALLDGDYDATPKYLGNRLATDAPFFGEVIRLVFRSKHGDASVAEPDDQSRANATNAYRLLSDWRIPPGLRADGSYDGTALYAWLGAVKAEASATGHLEIAMTMVGHVLTHVPADPNGLWIHRAACRGAKCEGCR